MTDQTAILENRIPARDDASRIDYVAHLPSLTADRERILVRKKGRLVVLKIDDIQWIEACRDYVNIYLTDRTLVVRATMKRFESQLLSHQFVRVHRSAMVNLAHLQEIHIRDGGKYNIVLRSGTNVMVSKRQKRKLKSTIEDSQRFLQTLKTGR